MPRVSVLATYNNSIRDIGRLNNYINGYQGLEPKYQYLVGEVVMLRLFSILETAICDIALKLASGAVYRNGNAQARLIPCSSMDDARDKMLNARPSSARMPYLKWTKADLIEKSTRYVLGQNGSFQTNVQNNSVLINEMRIVRNEVAHKIASTRAEYLVELARIYGVNTALPTGVFLTSTVRHPISNIQRYCQATPIVINDLMKG